jgi:hypothetical protein
VAPQLVEPVLGVGVRGNRVMLGQCIRNLPGQISAKTLGLVDADEFFELAHRIGLDAGPLGLDQRAVHLPFGADLGIAGARRRESSGENGRHSGDEQCAGRSARAGEAFGDPRRRDNAVVEVEDRLART